MISFLVDSLKTLQNLRRAMRMKIQLTLLMLMVVLMVGSSREINRFNEQKQWKRGECENICWGKLNQCQSHPMVVSESEFKVCVLSNQLCLKDC